MRFERALYANPDGDLNRVWWDLVERYQAVPRPEGRDEPDWAAKIHLAIAPVYYHNYVLGHLLSAQLRHHLESHVTHGPFYEHEVAGRYLMESFFGPGARENWRDTVLRATGEDLDPDHVMQVGGRIERPVTEVARIVKHGGIPWWASLGRNAAMIYLS